MVYTGDSKSPAERHEGSSPSSRTNLREVSNTGVDAIKYINLTLILQVILLHARYCAAADAMPCCWKPDDINRVITLKLIYARCMCVNVIGFLAYPMSRMKSRDEHVTGKILYSRFSDEYSDSHLGEGFIRSMWELANDRCLSPSVYIRGPTV